MGLFFDPLMGVIFIAPLILLLLDVLAGITRALHDQEFQFRRLADFLRTGFLQYAIVTVAIVFLWSFIANKQWAIVVGVFGQGVLSLSLLSSILENLHLSSYKPEIAIYHQPTDRIPAVSDFDATLEMPSVRSRRIGAMQNTDQMPAVEDL
jgi:ABC-type sugar transport system permease subunit